MVTSALDAPHVSAQVVTQTLEKKVDAHAVYRQIYTGANCRGYQSPLVTRPDSLRIWLASVTATALSSWRTYS
jgi:hypothetical protein